MGFVTITHFLAMKLMVQKEFGNWGYFIAKNFVLNKSPYSNREKFLFFTLNLARAALRRPFGEFDICPLAFEGYYKLIYVYEIEG